MKILINGIEYTIILQDANFNPDSMGRVNEKQAKIYIDKDMATDVKNNTILHELFHVLYRACGLNEHSTEENIIEALSNQLFSVMMNNKDFFIKLIIEE